jgi:hypothetical protein
MMGIPWDAHVDGYVRSYGDVGGWEIKSSKPEFARMRISPSDHDDKQYLLIVGVAPDYEAHGWLWGREAKRPELFTTFTNYRPKEYFPPREALREWHGQSASEAAREEPA